MTRDDSRPGSPVAITGMHRSGTSMITRGLHQSGLHLIGGDATALIEAADDNPEGFWENKAIVACNDDLLEAAGGAWDNPPTLLPLAVDDPRLAEIVEPATAALVGLRENNRWGFKDPRTCLTAGFWLDLQPDLRFVICVRNPLEVALSLKRRNQNSYSLGLALWERYYESILDLVPADRRVVTHYDTYFLDPVGELGRVCAFVGLDPTPPDVRTDLRHHDVGVSLDDANLSSGIKSLYARLCEEAGVPAPRSTGSDQGQVRRLVLDGTVAARHAEQRQQAIDRLEERLAEARRSEGELRAELARVQRESATRKSELDTVRSLVGSRLETLTNGQNELREQNRRVVDAIDTIAEMNDEIRDTNDQLVAASEAMQTQLQKVEDNVGVGFVAAVARRVRRVFGAGARRTVAPTKRVARAGAVRAVPVAKRTAKTTAKRLPPPVKSRFRRVRRAIADGQAGRRVKERADVVVARLPEPAAKAARTGARTLRRTGVAPKTKRVVRGMGRRLPAPTKRALRAVMPTPRPGGPARKRPVKKAAPAPRPKGAENGRRADVPKGPPAFKWQKGYERLVSETVPADASWAVITPGSRAQVKKVGRRRATTFPSADGQAPAADSLSLIAILEALRVAGTERLVLPEGSRRWFQEHPELRDHVARSHPTIADRDLAGAVFDLTSAAAVDRRGLLAEVNELASDLDATPAVLDWTGLGIECELPGFTTFEPPTDDSLPYFDRSIEIVVVTSDRDLHEACRVASVAVLTVVPSGGQFVMTDMAMIDGCRTGHVDVVVCAADPTDPGLRNALIARVEEAGARIAFDAESGTAEADVVIVLEPGVLPLANSITALAAAAHAQPDRAVVAKVLDAHGRVESAGGMVFADGTHAGIAAGTLDVRGPWHEFVRPVCWGGGMVASAPALFARHPLTPTGDFVAWGGRVWIGGGNVTYWPRAVVVRVGAPREGRSRVADGWESLLGSRPERPAKLSEGAWRHLLASDDPEALASRADR